MRLTSLSLGALTLLLLIAVPVNAAPALHKDSQTSYNLSVSISVSQSCEPIPTSTLTAGIVCPVITMISPSLDTTGPWDGFENRSETFGFCFTFSAFFENRILEV